SPRLAPRRCALEKKGKRALAQLRERRNRSVRVEQVVAPHRHGMPALRASLELGKRHPCLTRACPLTSPPRPFIDASLDCRGSCRQRVGLCARLAGSRAELE